MRNVLRCVFITHKQHWPVFDNPCTIVNEILKEKIKCSAHEFLYSVDSY